ncbi:MAG: fused MFS/spermidine synthase [Deltaproteobacteria bacterium]|nr:fused MFS/spermidine synthase [Deltaproteobacteria bacterium]
MPDRLISLAFFFSGAAGLVLEVVWCRLLHLSFGANAPAVSTVLAVYMGGMALGSWLVERWSWLRRRPWRAYAALEVLIAASALLLPGAIEALAPLHRWATAGLESSGSLLAVLLVRALIVGSLLVLPTVAMGATLPLLSEGARGGFSARRIGMLYAINLAGAVVGSAAVGFVLIPQLGLSASNLVAAALDLSAAALALRSARDRPAVSAVAADTPRPRLRIRGRLAWIALIGLACSGLLAMQLQVLWSRALSVVIGSSTYAFSLILVVTLLGMAVGGRLIASSAAPRQVRRPLRWLGWLFALAALGIAVGSQLVDRLPLVIRDAAQVPRLNAGVLFTAELLIVGAVVLVPAVALGGVLPAVLQVTQRQVRRDAGQFVGRAYALNTLGAIIGSALGGFGTLPLLGVDRGMLVTAGCYGALAAGTLYFSARLRQGAAQRWGLPALVAALSIAILFAPGFNVLRWNLGFFRLYLPLAQGGDDLSNSRLLFHRDGIVSTVTVEDHGESIALKVNGKVDASSKGDMPTQVLSGLLPLCLAEAPRRAVVIGFGSGVTAGAILTGSIEELVLIELEQAVLEAGHLFSWVNEHPWRDPRTRVVVDDGRNYLARVDGSFDIIVSEPSNPWMSGASSLFTREFWHLAHGKLSENGVFLQWIQLYELDAQRIRSLVGTFARQFEHVLMFTAHPRSSDTFLVGSRRPLRLDLDRARALFADPAAARFLERAELHSPIELAGLILFGDEEVRAFAAGAPENNDDNAYVEFHAPLDLIAYAERDADLPMLAQLEGRRRQQIARYTSGPLVPGAAECETDLQVSEVLIEQGHLEDAVDLLLRVRARCERDRAHKARSRRLGAIVDVLLQADRESVVDPVEVELGDERYLLAVMAMIQGREKAALEDFAPHVDIDRARPAWLYLFGYLLYQNGNVEEADQLFERLLKQPDFVEHMPEVYYYAARVAYDRDRCREAAQLARFFVEARAVEQGWDPLPEVFE